MYSGRPLHRDEWRQDIPLEHTYSSTVPILDVAWKTCHKQWTIGRGGKRGSEISVLRARDDDEVSSAICGRWFDLQWLRSQYTLLMRPNKFETADQCFLMSFESVRWIFNSIHNILSVSSFPVTFQCTAGRILLGCTSAQSLRSAWMASTA